MKNLLDEEDLTRNHQLIRNGKVNYTTWQKLYFEMKDKGVSWDAETQQFEAAP